MISRFLLGIVLVVVMLAAGPTTYLVLASKTSKVAAPPQKPTASTPRPQAYTLPGTIYIAQQGALYSLSVGRFHQLTPEAGWTMPALVPDGTHLLAIKTNGRYSDVYVLSRFGSVTKRVTNNAAPPRNRDTGANHWAFYPRLSPDGKTLWFAYDQPKYGYNVIMSVWAMPLSGTIKQGKLWTSANDYSGGDVQPIPVKTGMIYTKYGYGPDTKLVGQLWFTNRARAAGKPLTSAGEDCRSPAVSPSGTQIAMICTYEKQVSYLERQHLRGAQGDHLQPVGRAAHLGAGWVGHRVPRARRSGGAVPALVSAQGCLRAHTDGFTEPRCIARRVAEPGRACQADPGDNEQRVRRDVASGLGLANPSPLGGSTRLQGPPRSRILRGVKSRGWGRSAARPSRDHRLGVRLVPLRGRDVVLGDHLGKDL